ncbi:MAG TPA: peptide deformylase [Prolixibacteraceae bacterium]|nr:peptide deformylase [Prolixibacteraceae bacterium]HPT30655.1 peptide deformylase [Prolixibacteraceae bacterium]
MIFPIVVYGDPILRKKAEPITPDYPGLAEFLTDFWETMYVADGVGLAAPQVGRSIRIFVLDASAGADDDPSLKDFKKVFINPVMLETPGEDIVIEEGCLSLPEIREKITRPDTVRIRYQDENFEVHEETFSGFAARIIQHEYDHLEGKMFIDYLSPLRRKLMKNRLMNISKGKVTPKYKIRVPV